MLQKCSTFVDDQWSSTETNLKMLLNIPSACSNPVWKSLLPVVNYTINDTEEINSIWPLAPGVTRIMSRFIWSQPGQMWHKEAQEAAGAPGADQETLDITADLSQHHSYVAPGLSWPFIWPRKLSDPCYDNITPRPSTCLLSWLLAWQGSQEQVQWSSCSLVFKPTFKKAKQRFNKH